MSAAERRPAPDDADLRIGRGSIDRISHIEGGTILVEDKT